MNNKQIAILQKYKPPVKSSVKIEKKNPLEVLKAAGYSELDNCGVGISLLFYP